jgi:hypothetical protein
MSLFLPQAGRGAQSKDLSSCAYVLASADPIGIGIGTLSAAEGARL